MKFIALFCFLVSFGLTKPDRQVCIWAKIQTMTTPESIDSLVNFAKTNQYTVIFAQVRSRGDAAYLSKFVPKYNRIQNSFDPLDYLIKKGHSAGIQIHAWLNMYVVWTRYNTPIPSTHIYKKTDWLDHDFSGLKGNKNIYLSPIHPEVNNYLLGVIDELVNHYDVDGIHLDYIRFKDDNYGLNTEGLKAFGDIYMLNISDENLKMGIPQKHKSKWNKFKKESVTSLIKRIRRILNWHNPEICLSVAVKPNLIEAKSRFSQDWGLWLRHGLIDYAVPMNYYAEKEFFIRDLKLMKSRLPEPIHDKMIIGVGCYNQGSESVSDKVKIVLQERFGGVSFFAYDTHKHNPAWFDKAHKTLK